MILGRLSWSTLWMSVMNVMATIDPRLSSNYRPGLTVTPQMIQGDDYLKNVYIRSNLIEDPKQAGIRLELQITLLDSVSCAPLEDALVEIWGADSHGVYESDMDQSGCSRSSSLRGAFETNSEGVARFYTIFPGPQGGRPPHLNAVIRTDWYEHNLNHTVDSDASWAVSSIGQIFFPDHINSEVLNRSDYQTFEGSSIRNQGDPIYRAQSDAWQAHAQLSSSNLTNVVRAHVTIPVEAHRSTSLTLAPAPYLCTQSQSDKSQSSNLTKASSYPSTASSKLEHLSFFTLIFVTFISSLSLL